MDNQPTRQKEAIAVKVAMGPVHLRTSLHRSHGLGATTLSMVGMEVTRLMQGARATQDYQEDLGQVGYDESRLGPVRRRLH